MKRLLFHHKDTNSYRNRADELLNLSKTGTLKTKYLSPWFNSLPQIGSTCTKGPSFCCSCSNSSRYWLRRRNPIQSHRTNTEKEGHDSGDDTRTPRTATTPRTWGTRFWEKASRFQESNRNAVLPGSVRWCRGPHNRHRGHRPGRGEAFVRGCQRLHGGGPDRGRMKLLPIARGGGGGGGGRREDEIAFSLNFYLVLSPSPLCGKINRGGFQRNRAYEMSKNGRFLWGFFGWLASFLPSL